MQIAYKTINKHWQKLEDIIGDGFVIDEGVSYSLEAKGRHEALICEQNEKPAGNCGESFTKTKITPYGNSFYIKTKTTGSLNIACDTVQTKKPTPSKHYFNKIISVNNTKYKCTQSFIEPAADYELSNNDLENFSIDALTFDNLGLSNGDYVFSVESEDGYLIAETTYGTTIHLHRDSQYDTEVEFYYTYEENGETKRAKMLYDPPVEEDRVYNLNEMDEFAYVKYVIPQRYYWTLNGQEINLADYGMEYTGEKNLGDTITIYYQKSSYNYVWSELNG